MHQPPDDNDNSNEQTPQYPETTLKNYRNPNENPRNVAHAHNATLSTYMLNNGIMDMIVNEFDEALFKLMEANDANLINTLSLARDGDHLISMNLFESRVVTHPLFLLASMIQESTTKETRERF